MNNTITKIDAQAKIVLLNFYSEPRTKSKISEAWFVYTGACIWNGNNAWAETGRLS